MQPKLCYVSQFEANDSSALSGTNKTVYEALKLHTSLHYVSALKQAPSRRYQFQNLFNMKTGLVGSALPYHTWKNIRKIASSLADNPKVHYSSHILCSSSITAAACIYANLVVDDKKIFIYSDATVKCLHGYYPEWASISKRSLHEAFEVENFAYSRCTGIIMASQWAANSLINEYQAEKSKVFVVPRAANMPKEPRALFIEEIESRRRGKNIVIIAKSWKRKGVDIAIEAVKELRNRGFKASLTVIGLNPSKYISKVPSFVRYYPNIDKSSPNGWGLFTSLMQQAAIFIFPTQAEAMGIALTEACAFSLPIVASNTGGVSTVVDHNVNGILLNPASSYYDYANAIQLILSSNTIFEKMSYSARYKYICNHTPTAVGGELLNIVYGQPK